MAPPGGNLQVLGGGGNTEHLGWGIGEEWTPSSSGGGGGGGAQSTNSH